MKYAEEHGLDIQGEMHYPPVMSFTSLKQIIDAVMETNSEVVIINDVDFIIANAYHDGQLIKMFEEKDIAVINSEIDISLSELYRSIDVDMLMKFKEASHYAVGDMLKESKGNTAVMTVDYSRYDFQSFVEKISEKSERICIIEMSKFDLMISKHIDLCIKDSYIKKVIVYDNELMTKSMQQYLSKLQTIDNIEIEFKEDYDMVDEQSFRYKGMSLN